MKTTEEMIRKTANAIIARLSGDIAGRKGIGDEWQQIGHCIMADEIRPRWRQIITEEISEMMGEEV